jgi:hypothetical protein
MPSRAYQNNGRLITSFSRQLFLVYGKIRNVTSLICDLSNVRQAAALRNKLMGVRAVKARADLERETRLVIQANSLAHLVTGRRNRLGQ